jgi:hypothetical protein
LDIAFIAAGIQPRAVGSEYALHERFLHTTAGILLLAAGVVSIHKNLSREGEGSGENRSQVAGLEVKRDIKGLASRVLEPHEIPVIQTLTGRFA